MIEIISKKENLDKELSFIQDKNLRKFVSYVLLKAPDPFWVIPASTSGKYHPSYALGEGGLVRHTKAAVAIAMNLLPLEMYSNINRDEVIAALILHDVVKVGFTDDVTAHTEFHHPAYAAQLIETCFHTDSFDVEEQTILNIWRVVMSHMGQWNTSKDDEVELPKPELDDEKFVHLCDYLASRKNLEVIL